MAFDLEEQEKLDALKDWWKRYGNWIAGGIAALVIAGAGAQWWKLHQRQQASEAATLYAGLLAAHEGGQAKGVKDAAAVLMEKYPGTAYAPRAALIVARSNFETGDFKSARAQLQWVIDHTDEDAMKQLARLRLAALWLDEKNPQAALELLDVKHDEAFAARFNDLKGDALVMQDKTADARAAYKIALDKLEPQSPFRKYVEIKLDALGGVAK